MNDAVSACQRLVGARLPEIGREWVNGAAQVLSQELAVRGAQAHRTVVEPLCEAHGFSQEATELVGDVIDTLQLAIDVADNLADEVEDAELGRPLTERYGAVPRPFLVCLPALLIGAALAGLTEGFGRGRFRLTRASSRTTAVLSRMAVGQCAVSLAEKIELTSGQQGLLLCLPAWLAPDDAHVVPLERLEAWSVAFGRTWELLERYKGSRSFEDKRAWVTARAQAVASWPSEGPFGAGGKLHESRLLAPLMC